MTVLDRAKTEDPLLYQLLRFATTRDLSAWLKAWRGNPEWLMRTLRLGGHPFDDLRIALVVHARLEERPDSLELLTS